MAKTKNMHYLSQCISINFLSNDKPKTFWEYNPETGKTVPKNIEKLFARRRSWGQELEEVLSGNSYENKMGPLLKELSQKKMKRLRVFGPTGIREVQFNAEEIENSEHTKLLSKLLLQIALLQRSVKSPDEEVEKVLREIFASDGIAINMHLLLVEINPLMPSPPLVLIDGMTFHYIVPDLTGKTAGHGCFMFPISERRFLLWISKKEDYTYFAAKYKNIHYLNLCRISQHEKKCRVACANKEYLEQLVQNMSLFNENSKMPITIERNWV